MANTLIDPVVDSKAPPKEGSRDHEILGWAQGLHKEGRARRRHWEGVWWQNIAFFMGDFWSEWDPYRNRLVEPVKKPRHRVRIAINLAQAAILTQLAKLTKNRPIIDVLSRSNSEEDLNAAKVGDKILNNYIEKKFNMARVRKELLNWVLLCGKGAILVDWDESALGEIDVYHDSEGNPIFDPNVIEQYKEKYRTEGRQGPNVKKLKQGELLIKAVSPFQLVWDFSVNNFDDAAWCIYSDVMDIDEVYRRWGIHVDAMPNVLPGIIENRLMGRMDLTGELKERPVHTQKLTEVHTLWVKPGHAKFPDGLCFIWSKDTVIQSTKFSYSHGELPVHVMSNIELPTTQQSMSIIQQLRGPVLELSKTESQLIENRNLMANPIWLIPKQLGIESEIQNRPGFRLEFNYMPNIPEPKPVEMPEMPKYVVDMIGQLKEDIRDISGQGETSQGKVPPGARSGVAIAYMQEEDDTRLGPIVQNFETTMEQVGYQVLRVVAEKYDTPRTVAIHKISGSSEVFDFEGVMLAGVHGTLCRAGSALPRSKAAKQQFILDLWDRKLEQDPRKVRQMLEMGEGEPDEWEVDLDQAEWENNQLKQEEDPGVEEWYNHPAHHYIHRNFMKSAEFRKLNEEIKEGFRHHDEEHTQAEQRQAAELAATQAAQGGGQGQQGAPGGSAPGESSAPPGANGQTNPQGPPSQFTSASSPRTLMEGAGP